MTIAVPTRAELREALQATLKALLPEIVVTKDSDIGGRIEMLVEAAYGIHRHVRTVQDDQFVSDRTSTEALDLHAEAKLRGGRKGPTLATATLGLTVTGTAGSILTIGDALTYEDGTQYELASGGTMPAAGSMTVDVEAITPGAAGNRDVGETLTFTSPPSGINAEATIAVALENGQNQETDGELIARLKDAYRNPPAGGQFSDHRQSARSVEGVKDAYVYGPSTDAPTGRRGLGFFDVAILGPGTGSARVPTATVQGNVEDQIEEDRPSATRDFNVFLPTTTAQPIEVNITPEVGFEFDWTKIAAVVVVSWTASTRTLIVDDEIADFAGAGKRSLKAGDRVLVGVGGAAGSGTGSEVGVVESFVDDTPSGQATIVFRSAFLVAPVAGGAVEPAGPLTDGLLAAAKAHFDGLGPARGTGADPEQEWDDTLRVNMLAKALAITGVKDVAIASPGDVPATHNVTPSDPGGTDPPELLVYSELNLHPPIGT